MSQDKLSVRIRKDREREEAQTYLEDHVSVSVLCEKYAGVNRRTVLRCAKKNRVQTRKLGRHIFIPVSELPRLIQ